jgi:predicted  nucleic acid-binding Zn-ribbon protein
MRGFVQQWSALIAAVLVVLSIVSTRSTLRTQVGGVHDRLTALEKHMEALRNALEGQQGIGVRMATLDIRVNEQLQRLMAQRDTSLERHEQDTFTTQDALQALQTTLDTIATMTQRIAFVEEMLLEMQGGLAELRQQRTNANR